MRYAVEFSRLNDAAFISHLDMQRTVMRALRRSGLTLEYSEGFNPHIRLSFASAAPVGLSSVGEMFEFGLVDEMDINALKSAFPPSVPINRAAPMKEGAPKLAAALYAADYIVTCTDAEADALLTLTERSSVCVDIKKHGKIETIEARPLILGMRKFEEGAVLTLRCGGVNLNVQPLLASVFDDVIKFEFYRKKFYTLIGGEIAPLYETVIQPF